MIIKDWSSDNRNCDLSTVDPAVSTPVLITYLFIVYQFFNTCTFKY